MQLCPYAVIMISENYCKPAAESPPCSSVVPSPNEIDMQEAVSKISSPGEGVEVMPTKDYGIGIDCHSRFLEINVLVKRGSRFYEYCRQADTSWDALKEAYQWVINVLDTCADPPVMLSSPLHYCIESTSIPILSLASPGLKHAIHKADLSCFSFAGNHQRSDRSASGVLLSRN